MPLPKVSKEMAIKNHIITAPLGASMRTLDLYNFKNADVGRLDFKINDVCAGKPGYRSTVEFWLGDDGLAIGIEKNGELKYFEVSKKAGYKEINIKEKKINSLPQKWDKTKFYRLRVLLSSNNIWFYVDNIHVLQTSIKAVILPFYARVSGASLELQQTETKPEELKIVIDANNIDVIQKLPNIFKGKSDYKFKILETYDKEKQILEFWFNKQSLCLMEMADGTFKFYTFTNKQYTEIALPKSFKLNKKDANTIQISRDGSNVWLILNGIKLGSVRDLITMIECKLRVRNYKIEGYPY